MAITRGTSSVKIPRSENEHDCHYKFNSMVHGTHSPQVLILPNDTSENARLISLKNPRCSKSSRYLICPVKGLFELKEVAGNTSLRRSWFLHPDIEGKPKDKKLDEIDIYSEPTGHTMQRADLLIATAIDPLFIILPSLMPLPEIKSSKSLKKLFLSRDEYLERLISHSPQISNFLETSSMRELFSYRIAAVCDMLDVDGEKLYRMNEDKLVEELLRKAMKMANGGLPTSIEESIVKRSLEIPNTGMKYEEDHQPVHRADGAKVGSSLGLETSHRQGSLSSNICDAKASKVPTDRSPTPAKSIAPEHEQQEAVLELEIINLLRTRVSLSYIFSNYISPHICEILREKLIKSKTLIDFGPLDVRLAHVSKLRQNSLCARSNDDFSRKRSRLDDGEPNFKVEKKSKEESKKSNAICSRGVKVLKKANISGMKKMSEFFKKS
ncbi:putative ribonuclease h2 subunit b protein [Golovinomyces cichoracearum]|uniref:Ribonuclease H2 subunit B n=1 Tax=Golovinomyces cichoracearum TaxID=62708 RepID=A0A420J6E3_9PEZI|nr:putative ribonuclease h2 subunit b protein [Golovinomyces cichoracearum]